MILALFQRFLGKNQSHRNDLLKGQPPEQLVEKIQQGDLRLRNQFITDYQPYVAKLTSQFCKRYIDPARDDEFSISLSAFNEAINQFSPVSGRSFLGFSETVIRRRLIDYVRKEQKFNKDVPYSSFDTEDDENNIINPVETHQAIDNYDKQRGVEERNSEIIDLNRCLAEFDIRFTDLVDGSPKHTDSRDILFSIGKSLAEDASLMKLLLTKRLLPIKELMEYVQVSRKTLERNRKFIIAVALIYNGPYAYLREYLQLSNGARKGE